MLEAVFLLTAIATIPLAVLLAWIGLRRVKKIKSIARDLGLRYEPIDTGNLARLPFGTFPPGEKGRATNVLSGSLQGTEVRAFDYFSPKQKRPLFRIRQARATMTYSVAMVKLDASLPHLIVALESRGSKLAHMAGFRDIEMEWAPFNDTFDVRCADRRFATALLDARMMEWLAGVDGRFGFEVHGDAVLCHAPLLKATEIPTLLDAALEFRRRIPTVVASLYGPRTPAKRQSSA